MQVAPFSHSLSSQSSELIWQVGPSKPSGHAQLWHTCIRQHAKFFMRSIRFKLCCNDSKVHLSYLYNPSSSSSTWHVPPLAHGLLTQAFRAVSQFLPWDGEQIQCSVLSNKFNDKFKWLFTRRSNLESWGAAALVDLHQVTMTDALVETRTGQTGVTLGQYFSVHIS